MSFQDLRVIPQQTQGSKKGSFRAELKPVLGSGFLSCVWAITNQNSLAPDAQTHSKPQIATCRSFVTVWGKKKKTATMSSAVLDFFESYFTIKALYIRTDTYSEKPFHPQFCPCRLWQHFQAEQWFLAGKAAKGRLQLSWLVCSYFPPVAWDWNKNTGHPTWIFLGLVCLEKIALRALYVNHRT